MSCSRGNENRTRSQKHKNRTVFKNDLHDKTPMQQKLNALQICEVCQPCKAIIEWKIKYKKYKPLPKPKTCCKCKERNIKKAYHVLCRNCAKKERVCPKCMKSSELVDIEPPVPTAEEELKLKVEMERLIKTLSERKRRSFQRYMKKGKIIKCEDEEGVEHQPHTREDLLLKIEQLTIAEEPDPNDDNESTSSIES